MDKGVLFVGSHMPTYEGMIIGEHNLESDLEMNAVRAKATTNIRVTGAVGSETKLQMHKVMGLEECISYVRADELVEVTPKNIRLRKMYLDPNDRKRSEKQRLAG